MSICTVGVNGHYPDCVLEGGTDEICDFSDGLTLPAECAWWKDANIPDDVRKEMLKPLSEKTVRLLKDILLEDAEE